MDLLSGGSFYADPHGWVLEDSVPVTNRTGPQSFLSRLEPLGDEVVGIALLCLNSCGRGMRELACPGDTGRKV